MSQQFTLTKSGSPALSTWLEWILILTGLGLISFTEAFRLYTLLGLACLLGAFVLRSIREGKWWLNTRLEIPGLVFLASAGLATWIAYDRGTAFLQFERFIAGGVLFYAIAGRKIIVADRNSSYLKEVELRWMGVGLLALALGIALYWPLHQDYSSLDNKFFLITNVLEWIQTHLPAIPGPYLHHDTAGGTLILALPIGVGLAFDARRRGAAFEALLESVVTVIVFIGLLLTISRGAWLGLAIACGLAMIVVVQRRWFFASAARIAFWVVVVIFFIAVLELLILSGTMDRIIGMTPDPTGALQSRTTLWSKGGDLIGDYVYTGSGLMTVPRVYSIYELLIAVPFQSSLHNLYLEIWLEQGILGEVALLTILGIVTGWGWKAISKFQKLDSDTQSILGWAGLIGVLAIAAHGLVNVVLYEARTVPFVGLILGYAYLADSMPAAAVPRQSKRSPRLILGGAFIGLLLLLSALYFRKALSAFYANLGAIEQTRLEMSIYNPDNFQNDSLDQVRQELSLSGVQALLRKSLSWNPENRTALLRLGDMALSLNDVSSAQQALQSAWDAGYRDNRTRLLYGDLLVMQGQIQAAASVQKGVPWAVGRLSGQAWYRYWLNNDYRRALDTWQTVLLLDPSDQNARYWSEQALQKMK